MVDNYFEPLNPPKMRLETFGPIKFVKSRRAARQNNSIPSQVSQVLNWKLASSVVGSLWLHNTEYPSISGKSSFIDFMYDRAASIGMSEAPSMLFHGETPTTQD